MNAADFLADVDLRPIKLAEGGFEKAGLTLGPGSAGLEVVVAEARRKPSQMRSEARGGPDKVAGQRRSSSSPSTTTTRRSAARPAKCRRYFWTWTSARWSAFAAPPWPSRTATRRPASFGRCCPKSRNRKSPACETRGSSPRTNWKRACRSGPTGKRPSRRPSPCSTSAGATSWPGSVPGFRNKPQYAVLRCGQTKMAVAIFLDRSEACDIASDRFGGMTPVQYALAKADDENLDYVLVDHGSSLRIHTTAGKGVGRRGRTETFVEIHLDLLPSDRAGYLWLLFSGQA